MAEFHSEWVGIVEIDGFRRCAPTSVGPRREVLTTATAGDLRSAACFCILTPLESKLSRVRIQKQPVAMRLAVGLWR